MTVSNFIKLLKKQDQTLEVYKYCGEGELEEITDLVITEKEINDNNIV